MSIGNVFKAAVAVAAVATGVYLIKRKFTKTPEQVAAHDTVMADKLNAEFSDFIKGMRNIAEEDAEMEAHAGNNPDFMTAWEFLGNGRITPRTGSGERFIKRKALLERMRAEQTPHYVNNVVPGNFGKK